MKRYTLGSSSIGQLEKDYVNQVLDNNFISPGPVVAEVEKMCAEMHNMRYCVTLNSGQSAIQVGLQALVHERMKHDQITKPLIAIPASTYISTLAAAYYADCDFTLVDIELETGNMCPESLKSIIHLCNKNRRPIDIVIPVHLYGKACNSKIRDICWENKLLVLEDACEATCVPYTGWGHVLTTSFFSNHLISGGSGGAIMTNDKDLDLYCWKLINHGRTERFDNNDISRIADKFKFDTWGHSYKFNDVSAAIVKAQLERKDKLFTLRKNNANTLLDLLKDTQDDFILPDPEGHCFMMFPILLNDKFEAVEVIQYLNDHGVETRRMMPVTNQEVVLGQLGYFLDELLPNAAIINSQGFYVGVHPELSKQDMAEMAGIILDALEDQK